MKYLLHAAALCVAFAASANNFSTPTLFLLEGTGVDGQFDLFFELLDNDRVAVYKDVEAQEYGCHGTIMRTSDDSHMQFVTSFEEEWCKEYNMDFVLRFYREDMPKLCDLESVSVSMQPQNPPAWWIATDVTATMQRGSCIE